MIQHNIDEYEWVEERFDHWYLKHKQRDFAIARVWQFGGWSIQLAEEDPLPMKVDSLDAAKTIAKINAVSKFESYPNAYLYPRRTENITSKALQERVRRLGASRSRLGLD